MTATYIHKVRPDWTVALQPALTTRTPGIYLARTVLALAGDPCACRRDKTNAWPCTHVVPVWQLRLRCGHALGDYACASLPAARLLAARLGELDVDWTAAYGKLATHFAERADLRRGVVDLLTRHTSPRLRVPEAA